MPDAVKIINNYRAREVAAGSDAKLTLTPNEVYHKNALEKQLSGSVIYTVPDRVRTPAGQVIDTVKIVDDKTPGAVAMLGGDFMKGPAAEIAETDASLRARGIVQYGLAAADIFGAPKPDGTVYRVRGLSPKYTSGLFGPIKVKKTPLYDDPAGTLDRFSRAVYQSDVDKYNTTLARLELEGTDSGNLLLDLRKGYAGSAASDIEKVAGDRSAMFLPDELEYMPEYTDVKGEDASRIPDALSRVAAGQLMLAANDTYDLLRGTSSESAIEPIAEKVAVFALAVKKAEEEARALNIKNPFEAALPIGAMADRDFVLAVMTLAPHIRTGKLYDELKTLSSDTRFSSDGITPDYVQSLFNALLGRRVSLRTASAEEEELAWRLSRAQRAFGIVPESPSDQVTIAAGVPASTGKTD